LGKMLDIFNEFKCIEKLIRYKFPQYNVLFDKLIEIEEERIHGKFFSFLRCLPGKKRTYVKKKVIQVGSEEQQTIAAPSSGISEGL